MSNLEIINDAPRERRIIEKLAVGVEAVGYILITIGVLSEGSIALLGVGYIGVGDYFDKHVAEWGVYKEESPILDNVEWID